MNERLTIGLLFLWISGECSGVTRIWRPKMSRFESANAWQSQRAPCFGDTIQLQENRAIMISQHHTLSGLSLPASGELIFSEGAVLEIVDLSQSTYQQEANCPAKASDVPLVASSPVNSWYSVLNVADQYWFDPENWKTNAEGQQRRQIFLDSQRIPCNGDDVHLPIGHTFQIAMPAILKEPLLLKTFKVGPLFMTDRALAEYFSKPKTPPVFDTALNSWNDSSRLEPVVGTLVRDEDGASSAVFIRIGRASLAQWPCDAKYGCKCGNDRKEVMKELCEFIPKVEGFACEAPVEAEGQCQPFCGSVVAIKEDSAAKAVATLGRVQTMLDDLRDAEDGLSNDVEAYISITYDNTVQTIFVPSPKDPSDASSTAPTTQDPIRSHQHAATLLHAKLTSEESKAWVGSKSVSLTSSGKAVWGKLIARETGSSDGKTAGILSGVSVVLIILLVAGWMAWRRRRNLPFAFRSFDGQEEPLEMESGPSFLNPLYPSGEQGARSGVGHALMADDIDTINRNFMQFEDSERAGLAENEF